MRQPADPEVHDVVKDLGVDNAGGRRRRLTTATKRYRRGLARSRKLTTLCPAPAARVCVVKGSISPVSTWGHQAQGISPKRLKWIRQCLARPLGLQKLGCADTVFGVRAPKTVDPMESIITQHFQALARIVRRWPSHLVGSLESLWSASWTRLGEGPHPWRRVAGPVAAAQAYLKQLHIDAPAMNKWRVEGQETTVSWDQEGLADILHTLRGRMRQQALDRMASLPGGLGVEQGIDWTVPRKLLRRSRTRHQAAAFQTVWQGATVHDRRGGTPTCSLCSQPATLEHVLYSCAYWETRHKPPPGRWEGAKKVFPEQCLWLRGLVPSRHVRPTSCAPEGLEYTGVWSSQTVLDAKGLVFATDASGGPGGKDPRLRRVAWARLRSTRGAVWPRRTR